LRLAINLITGHVLTQVVLSFIYSAYLKGSFLLLLPLLFLSLFAALEI
jgi:hypothetical protein